MRERSVSRYVPITSSRIGSAERTRCFKSSSSGARGPLEVVEDEHDRALVGRGGEQARDRLEQEKPFGLGLGHLRRGQVGIAVGQLGHEAGELAAMGRDVSAPVPRRARASRSVEGPRRRAGTGAPRLRRSHRRARCRRRHARRARPRSPAGSCRCPARRPAARPAVGHRAPSPRQPRSPPPRCSARTSRTATGSRVAAAAELPAAAIGSHATAQVVTGSGRPFKATGPIGLKV